jgi:hypothetical protein
MVNPDVIGFFSNLPNPPSRTTTLGLTQPLANMSTRNLPLQAHKADNLTAICKQSVYKMWNPPRLTTL